MLQGGEDYVQDIVAVYGNGFGGVGRSGGVPGWECCAGAHTGCR